MNIENIHLSTPGVAARIMKLYSGREWEVSKPQLIPNPGIYYCYSTMLDKLGGGTAQVELRADDFGLLRRLHEQHNLRHRLSYELTALKQQRDSDFI